MLCGQLFVIRIETETDWALQAGELIDGGFFFLGGFFFFLGRCQRSKLPQFIVSLAKSPKIVEQFTQL